MIKMRIQRIVTKTMITALKRKSILMSKEKEIIQLIVRTMNLTKIMEIIDNSLHKAIGDVDKVCTSQTQQKILVRETAIITINHS